MAVTTPVRVVSKDVVIEFRPGEHKPGTNATHVQRLIFDTTVTSGTYRLWINGVSTGAITFTTGANTHRDAIDTAVEAVLGAASVVTAKISDYEFTITLAAANVFVRFDIADDSLTGGKVVTRLTTAGGQTYVLEGSIKDVSIEETTDTTDTTPIGHYDSRDEATRRSATVSLNIYEATEAWTYALFGGNRGLLTIWETGKVSGGKMVGMYVLLTDYSLTIPDHDKLEIALTGVKQGAYVYPIGTIYS